MRIVQINAGVLGIRWTWLPFWLAVNPKIKDSVEAEMRDAVLLGGVTNDDEDMDGLHHFVVRRLQNTFPDFVGLDRFLDSIRCVEEPDDSPTTRITKNES